jgi:hypothetical protein
MGPMNDVRVTQKQMKAQEFQAMTFFETAEE